MQYALCCGQAVPPPVPHRTAAKTGNKRRLCKSTASLPILSSGISIRPTLQPTSGPTDVCMSMPPMTSIRRAVAT